MSKRIGYAKIGRSMSFNPASYGMQGDPEAPQLLQRLARRNPDVTFVVVGKNDRYMEGMPPNVENPWVDLPGGQPYNNVVPGKAPPSGVRFQPYRNNKGGGFWVDNDVLARDYTVTEQIMHLDGMIIHLGQHGTSHIEIPRLNTPWAATANDPMALTTPHLWARNYGEYVHRGLNLMGDMTDGRAPVSIICSDPRNYMKARDIKWPTGTQQIFAQYQFERKQFHERHRDARTPAALGFDCTVARGGELWQALHKYQFANIELMILQDDWPTWGQRDFHDREPVGVATTATYVEQAEWRRSWVVREFVWKYFPDAKVYGKWDDKSLADVSGFEVVLNDVRDFPDLLGSWRTTVALPPTTALLNGLEWTAAKPFQCFAARVACFMVGLLDNQGWILPSRTKTKVSQRVADDLWSVRADWSDEELTLARWLRVNTPEEYASRVHAVASSPETWSLIVDAQRRTLQRRWDEQLLERWIEHQHGIGEYAT